MDPYPALRAIRLALLVKHHRLNYAHASVIYRQWLDALCDRYTLHRLTDHQAMREFNAACITVGLPDGIL